MRVPGPMKAARPFDGSAARLVRAAALGGLVTVASLACEDRLPPQGQVLVYLDTDAPVAAASSDLGAPLFDRVLVELFAPGESEPCPDCRRELVVDAEKMRARRFSFGFVPRPRVVGYRAHLILYRSAGGLGPRPASSIALVGYLPAVAEDGIKEVTARFRTDDVGKPRGTMEAPIIFDAGAPGESAVGSWEGARIIDCEGEPPAGSVCVPGGAFFMGDPRVTIDESVTAGAHEHLAVLPPFFLDRREVTVADIRASKLAKLDSRGRALDPIDDLSDELAGRCVYSAAPGPNEDLPVTCVTWELASRYCRAKGGELPSEAELEIVASTRGTTLLPWGDREPACGEAHISGCADAGRFDLGDRVLPWPPGTGTLDRSVLLGGEVVDLAANVAEWTRDVFQLDDGPCWSASILKPPGCADGDGPRSVKGGDFTARRIPFAQARRGVDPTFQPPEIGFRCSYPATAR